MPVFIWDEESRGDQESHLDKLLLICFVVPLATDERASCLFVTEIRWAPPHGQQSEMHAQESVGFR